MIVNHVNQKICLFKINRKGGNLIHELLLRMEGKVVLITGSSNGTGAVTAEEYSKLGAMVVVTGRDKTRVESVCDLCIKVSPTNQKVKETSIKK
ncbi:hypothetical protein B4U80_14484 [Leptotrombidium deliense]|uniref:Uncharacterized protein n=1 Tax=Leptotrombidium deliense TaxID=299467 RepID=A0A443RVK3_9ACAR|nr:hypothetical protein B4U80_14484 [Leptotrombidium deliense]